MRRLPAPRVEEEPVGIPAVGEVEQILKASGLGVEGLIAYPAEFPVILDKAQNRASSRVMSSRGRSTQYKKGHRGSGPREEKESRRTPSAL